MWFSAILVWTQTSEETIAAIPPRLSHSFAWLLYAHGPPGRARHSTSFIGYSYVHHSGLSFALQPPQRCQETKWTISDRALPANSKQISLSIEAPLNSGNAGFAIFLAATPSVLLRNSGPGLKLTQITGVSCVHFNPRKTKISQKKSLTPFFHRALQLLVF